MIELTTGINDTGRRLDRILRKALPQYSLSLLHRLLRQKKVMVNGNPVKPNTIIQLNDVIQIHTVVNENIAVNNNNIQVNEKINVKKEQLPQVLWQGSGIVIFNKQPGLATHGTHSLDGLVKSSFSDTLPPSLSFKPGPLHRLDKQTSGAIAFSQSLAGAQLFSRLLHEKKLVKTYLAIVEGCVYREELWQDELIRNKKVQKSFIANGENTKNAVMKVKPLASNDNYTLIEAVIITGRTHQIRVQSAAHGHPLAGDTKYGGKYLPGGNFYLHAWKIDFTALTEIDPPEFPKLVTAPIPETFIACVKLLFDQNTFSKIMNL